MTDTDRPIDQPPLVSIVVPSLNQGPFIRDAIESLLAQDHPAIEIVVVDGGSTDSTLDVLHDYDHDPRVRWTSEPDGGQSDAINKGWRQSRGQILSWLCADDGLYPGAVSKVVETFRRSPGAGFVYGRGDIIELDGTLVYKTPIGQRDAWQLVHHENFICQPAAFATRAALDTVGDVDTTLEYAMDWDLFIRLARSVPMVHTPEVLAWVRTYEGTKSIRGGHRRFREIIRVLHRYSDLRYPPSYLLFAAHSYESAGRRLLQRAPSAFDPVTRNVARLLRSASVAVSSHARRRFGADSGWYGDGWAAPKLDKLVPGDHVLVIRGRLPEGYDTLLDQVIAVTVDDIEIAREHLDPGDFELKLPLPDGPRHYVRKVHLEARKWFVPRRLGMNEDRRRLSFYLYELEARPS